MRKCFSAERFLLLRSRNISNYLHFSQRWISTTKTAPSKDDDLLDLLDQVGQDISIRTDARREHPRDAAEPYLEESAEAPGSTMLDLPLSPLMDPKAISARQRYRTPKPEPTGPASALDKKLSKSPFAHALVTPIRRCQLTEARLPSYFLLGFGVTKHPTTGAQWHLPRLAVDPLLTPKRNEALPEISLQHENADATTKIEPTLDGSWNVKAPENDATITKPTEIKNVEDLPPREPLEKLPLNSSTVKHTVAQEFNLKIRSPVPNTRTGSSSYFVCSQPALKLLSDLHPKSHMRILPTAWKADSWIKADKLVWRKDMDKFVLELERKKTSTLLKLLASSRAGYVVACAGYKSVDAHHQVAAVLWLGASGAAKTPRSRKPITDSATSIIPQELEDNPLSSRTVLLLQDGISADHNPTLQTDAAASEESEPPFYAMIKHKSHFIPIYNLPVLLGSEHLAQLRAAGPSLRGTIAVIKKKQRTVPAQMELWKLMGYLAHTETLGALRE